MDMVAREFIQRELVPAVEAEVFVSSKEESVFQRGFETVRMNFAFAGNDARKLQDRLHTETVVATVHLEDRVSKRPDNLVLNQQRRCFFTSQPANRYSRLV